MNIPRSYQLLAACCSMLLLLSCSDKNSREACLHEVSMNLDKGNFDAVLSSECADAMQKGAAYFGRAGYDTKDIINNLIQATSSDTCSSFPSGCPSSSSDLSTYLVKLIKNISQSSLDDIESALIQYGSIQASDSRHKDALFIVSLVQTIKSLVFLKLISVDMTGEFNATCDINANTIKDGPDAASCALIASTNINSNLTTSSCGIATNYVRSNPVDISFPNKNGTYSGIIVTLAGSATTSCPKVYNKLLYKDTANKYWVVTTLGGEHCTGSDGRVYPCPLEKDGKPLDLVNAIDNSIDTAISAMDNALVSTGTATSDVQQAVNDIKTKACPSAGGCTSSDIASYLQTVK